MQNRTTRRDHWRTSMRSNSRVGILVFLAIGLVFAGCKKKETIAQLGQRCNAKTKCAQGLKCYSGTCEDLSGNGPACKFVKEASGAIMNASPKDLIKNLNYDYDPNFIAEIPNGAAQIYKGFAQGLPERSCKRLLECEMPKLGIGYSWFWTRAAYEATKVIPEGAKKVSPDAISVNVLNFEQTAIGEDPSMYPEIKIKQMTQHRFGCKAEVEVKVREDYAGFVTFHFWRNTGCEFVPADKNTKDSIPQFKCQGEEILKDPKYTYTVYLYPFSSQQLEAQKKADKNKSKDDRAFFTGNPGTYKVNVWAYNPIDENLFGEHKQFEDEAEMKKYTGFAFCPKYTENVNENGCGCIGFVKNKITVTLDPDPFFMPMDDEKCAKRLDDENKEKEAAK